MASKKDSQPNGSVDHDVEIGMKADLRIWQQRYRRDGQQETVAVESLVGAKGSDTAYAVVVNQIFSERNRLESVQLTINSPHILKAFRDVIKSYPVVASNFQEPFDMQSPFRMLYHYWDELEEYKESSENDEVCMHLNILFEFMEADMGQERKQCQTQIKDGQIDYSRAWIIYKPGEVQVNYQDGHPWLLKVVKTAYEENKKIGKYMEIHCTYIDYDGTIAGTADKTFRLVQKQFFAAENPANIRDLPVYPRKFLNEGDSLEQRLSERGSRFLSLQGICIRQYDGLANYLKEPGLDFYDPDMADWDPVWLPFTETGRVIIDRKTFLEENYLAPAAVKADEEATSKTKFLCPPFAYGYSLARKEWCKFYLDNTTDVQWNRHSFDSLILKESQKTLLKALVTSHAFPDNPRDRAQQKGKGLVILLHGTPGSGKTLTAECSAEITGRSLFVTSMAELNKHNRPYYFEYHLSQVLQYATIWKSIVLLDEADVFLESRHEGDGPSSSSSSERNALVAIFLAKLEYFSGIVFLTTNRVHVFDSAMKSRIHLALGYSPPELEMRRLIWSQALNSIPHDQRDLSSSGDGTDGIDTAVETLITEKLNGREITNTINTARTLARYGNEPLKLSHIQTVLGVKNEFDSNLKRMRSVALAGASEGHGHGHGRGSAVMVGFEPLVRRGSVLCEEPEGI